MKKQIMVIVSACMIVVSQLAFAAGPSGIVVTDQFQNELTAVNEAKKISASIEAGQYSALVGIAADRCQSLNKVKYDSRGFTVSPIWVETSNGFEKEFLAKINYKISCDLKIQVGSL